MADLKYPRALVKLSGESLAGERGFGIEPAVVKTLIEEIGAVHAAGVHLGLVVGGGNIVRGTVASQQGMDRVSADYMGMLATVINALALQDALESSGVETRVMTAILPSNCSMTPPRGRDASSSRHHVARPAHWKAARSARALPSRAY